MMMMAHDDSDDERICQGGYGGTLGGWVGGSELREGEFLDLIFVLWGHILRGSPGTPQE